MVELGGDDEAREELQEIARDPGAGPLAPAARAFADSLTRRDLLSQELER